VGGLLAMVALNAMVAVAAFALSTRITKDRGAELWLVWFVVASELILLPTHALALLGSLTAGSLATSVTVLCTASLVLLTRNVGLRAWRVELGAASYEAVVRVVRLLRRLVEGGPVSIAAALLFFGCLLWALLLTYLLPSESWDGVWYHDLIVGYTIQNHGYAAIALPRSGFTALVQEANAFPRNSEMLSLWFSIFWNNRLIELPNTLAVLPLGAATYALCVRYGRSAAWAFVWVAALALVPGARLQLRSTYVDVHFAAYLVTAFYFCTHEKLGGRITLVAIGALALTFGTKTNSLFTVPLLAALAVVFTALAAGPRRALLWSAVGVPFILGTGGFMYLLAYKRFGSPLWPFAMHGKMGLHFDGPIDFSFLVDKDPRTIVDALTEPPVFGHNFPDPSWDGFGLAAGFVLLPFALLAYLGVVIRVINGLARAWASRSSLAAPDAALVRLVAIAALSAFAFLKGTTQGGSRFHLHLLAMAAVTIHAFAALYGPRGATSLATAATALATNAMNWYWAKPAWDAPPERVAALLAMEPLQRLGKGAQLSAELAPLRERELGEGTLVLWCDDDPYPWPFPSLLWNEHFSNRLLYEPAGDGASFLDRAESLNARWVMISSASVVGREIERRRGRWERVGPLRKDSASVVVYRRSRPTAAE
jgi:hypothetical protein